MLLTEFFSQPDETKDYRSEEEDESRAQKSDTRKTRLTLSHINKLRIMNDARSVEREQKIREIQAQYKNPSDDGM